MDGQNNQPNPQPGAAVPEAATPATTAPQTPSAAPVTSQPEMSRPAPQEAAAAPVPAAPTPEAQVAAPTPAQSEPASQAAPQPMPPVPAQPLGPTPDTLQQAAGIPAVPPGAKRGISIWLVMSFIVLLFAGIGGYYFYMMDKAQPTQVVSRMPYPSKAITSPTVSVSLSPSASSSQSAAGQGTVAGTLCYPSSAIPAGTITAKDMTTSKLYTQAYAGTSAGGGTKYTFPLPPGMYRIKFTPTQYPTVVGYYTDYSSCVGNPVGPNCSGQKVRPLLTATVSANMTVQNVNLCDYYYPTSTPPQF